MPREIAGNDPWSLQVAEYALSPLKPNEIRVQTEYAAPKHGTELHGFVNKSDETPTERVAPPCEQSGGEFSKDAAFQSPPAFRGVFLRRELAQRGRAHTGGDFRLARGESWGKALFCIPCEERGLGRVQSRDSAAALGLGCACLRYLCAEPVPAELRKRGHGVDIRIRDAADAYAADGIGSGGGHTVFHGGEPAYLNSCAVEKRIDKPGSVAKHGLPQAQQSLALKRPHRPDGHCSGALRATYFSTIITG